MNEREKTLAEIRERLERADDGRLAFVLAFLRVGENPPPATPEPFLDKGAI